MTATVVVRASIAPMHTESRVSSPQTSQRLAGHTIAVLEVAGDWLRVRGEDGYDGWMHRGYVAAGGDERSSDAARQTLSLGCVVHDAATGSSRALPLAAWLAPTERVVAGGAIDAQDRVTTFPRKGVAIARTAVERFAGTPYQWGGVTPWGADCSGLTQTTFWLHGVSLPRDAWQQAEVGDDAGTRAASWLPADLLFFSDRADKRITHVGMALGESRMVHLALGRGGYAVERLDATNDAYVVALMGRFVAARRVSL
jgi:gamma-D-glutamyl-L-lysine dipeptidyl-peptidase